MDAFLQFVIDHRETIGVILIGVISLITSTSWGLKWKNVGQTLTRGIERLSKAKGDDLVSMKDVKIATATESKGVDPAVAEAINAAVASAEKAVNGWTAKTTDKPAKALGKALFRAVPGVLRLLIKPMLIAVLLAGAMACNSLPKVVTVYPDGRTETRVDTAAVDALTNTAIAATNSLSTTLIQWQTEKAKAEAMGDSARVEICNKVIALIEKQLDNANAATKPLPATAEPETK